MTLWYDVSDIASWQLPHLTGIQRVTVGILSGLADRGVPCRLVRYDESRGEFVAVDGRTLPASIRCHLAVRGGNEAAAVVGAAPTPRELAAAAGGSPQPRRRFADRIVGTDPAARDLRQAFRAFKDAAYELRRQGKRWMKTRRAKPAVAPAGPVQTAAEPWAGTTAPLAARHGAGATVFAPGDVLLSLGATWLQAEHATEASRLRRQGVRVLRMIYDLIPTLKPQWVEPRHTAAITRWARCLLTESDHVFTISAFSQRELESYCDESGLPRPALSAIRLGDVLSGPAFAGLPPRPRFVPGRPFFVCVSTLDVRKNHRLLYDAWRMLAAGDSAACPDLLCIGTPHLYVADLLREIRGDWLVNGRIHLLHGIDDRELAWYYRNCMATIYPSWHEGWGLPVAESLGQGKICLASSATSIPEISADLPEFFEPHDTCGLVDLVARVLQDSAWRRQREAVISRSFRPTTWAETVGQILGVIDMHRDGRCQAA